MSQEKRRSFQRRQGERPYYKVFLISTEGQTTEREYFEHLWKSHPNLKSTRDFARPPRNSSSSPHDVLVCMEQCIERHKPLRKGDEAWLVVDKDSWTDDQLTELRNWISRPGRNGYTRYLAISNPKFEYWLLLHFSDAGVCDSNDCTHKLKMHVPNYSKHIDFKKYSDSEVRSAIERARRRDRPGTGGVSTTTIYVLVSHILDV